MSKGKTPGEREERRLLAISNFHLVTSMAEEYSNKTKAMSFLELVHEGTEGLSKAIDKFDEVKGFTFSTYATWWIKQSMVHKLAEKAEKEA